MSLLEQTPIAVCIQQENCKILQLNRSHGRFTVQNFAHELTAQLTTQRFKRCGLISALDYQAVHYQQLSNESSTVSVEESILQQLPSTMDNEAGFSYDFIQHDSGQIEAAISSERALQQLISDLAPLNIPVKVIEPIYHSIIRATNTLIPYLWPEGARFSSNMKWIIAELRQKVSTLIYCESGRFQRFEKLATAELLQRVSDMDDYWLFSFGDKVAQSALRTTCESQSFSKHIALSTAPLFADEPAPTVSALDNEIALVGLALRGFSQWHR
ncbi:MULTISPECIES: hypothetical protein [Idiomarina]|uniref:Uncharacterized protein n=2 Tax=Idiomarina TaxID=135575 RepID=A0A837NH80_9GAMM|nr:MULTISPECIES: hypothetical protein [Idiomarina]KPD24077.1 hypothetical protein AFK76_06000 [Idiomarina zobellii]RUO62029.1 hypothetical protein CWI73_11205 [Idiomarina piscisalsi]SDF81127.1 hypothetical protein SAMN04515658_10528 [Idiomarina zobellii]